MFGDLELEAMYQDIMGRAEIAGMRTVNLALEKIYQESQTRVPKGAPEAHEARATRAAGAPYPPQQLVDRGEIREATMENPVGMVYYEGPYAAAQEVGVMEYESKGGKPVQWEAEHYTTEGTGKGYLEESFKLVVAQLPEELAVQGRIAFGELSGPVTAKSSLRAAGRHQEFLRPPPTEEAQAMRQGQRQIETATESSFRRLGSPPFK